MGANIDNTIVSWLVCKGVSCFEISIKETHFCYLKSSIDSKLLKEKWNEIKKNGWGVFTSIKIRKLDKSGVKFHKSYLVNTKIKITYNK